MKNNLLNNLSDQELLISLKQKRSQEKALQAEILTYLQELVRRKLFLKRGYSSLFTFLELELGYCKSMAFYLNQSVKLCDEVETASAAIQKGELSFTTAGVIQSFFDREKYQEKKAYTKKEKETLRSRP